MVEGFRGGKSQTRFRGGKTSPFAPPPCHSPPLHFNSYLIPPSRLCLTYPFPDCISDLISPSLSHPLHPALQATLQVFTISRYSQVMPSPTPCQPSQQSQPPVTVDHGRCPAATSCQEPLLRVAGVESVEC